MNCRVDKNLHFVSGYSIEPGAQPVILNATDGQKEVARQLDLWSTVKL